MDYENAADSTENDAETVAKQDGLNKFQTDPETLAVCAPSVLCLQKRAGQCSKYIAADRLCAVAVGTLLIKEGRLRRKKQNAYRRGNDKVAEDLHRQKCRLSKDPSIWADAGCIISRLPLRRKQSIEEG